MSQAVWNGPNEKVTIAASATVGTASSTFSMPNNALGVLFWIPALTSSVTLELQAMQPKDGDLDADAWAPLKTILTGAATVTASTVDTIFTGTAASAYGFDADVLGAGVFRFVVRGATNTAATTIYISWRCGGDRN